MSGGYAAYDALDQAMMDDPMADFMNTEFDNGRIVTREGFTPAILNNAGPQNSICARIALPELQSSWLP